MTYLPFKVECKSDYPFYETIAAFNCEHAAIEYAAACAAATTSYTYRVTKRDPASHRRKIVVGYERNATVSL